MKNPIPACAAATLAAIALCAPLHAQDKASPFDPQVLFAPLSLPQPANAFRDGAGKPGPEFWQNRADYDIKARIDPATHSLAGEETITYTNHSPDALDALWLQLDQNIYKSDSRGALTSPWPKKSGQSTEGYQLDAVEVDGKPVHYLVDDTRLRVDLPAALKAKGGQLKLHIRYHYTVPGTWGGRTAVTPTGTASPSHGSTEPAPLSPTVRIQRPSANPRSSVTSSATVPGDA